MDIYLADILINNLISNAIKHNFEEKEISITTENKTLVISNYGQNELLHPEKLFLRFYREVNSVQSSGLGLAILKKICDLYKFDLSYSFSENQHSFTLVFK
jgi:hypothetical protein